MMRCSCNSGRSDPRTVQIRDIDDDVYAALARRAAEEGVSVPDLLRRQATRLTARPPISEWLRRTERRTADITDEQILDTLDELRGAWPDGR